MTVIVALALLYLSVSWLQLLVWFSWTGALARAEECYRTPGFPWAPETEAQHRARCLDPVEVRVDAVWLRLPWSGVRPEARGARIAFDLASAVIMVLHVLLVPVIAFHALRHIRRLQDEAEKTLVRLRARAETSGSTSSEVHSVEARSVEAEVRGLAEDFVGLREALRDVDEAREASRGELKITVTYPHADRYLRV